MVNKPDLTWINIEWCSDRTRLKQSVCITLKYMQWLESKAKQIKFNKAITAMDMEKAKMLLIQKTQWESFPDEMTEIFAKQTVDKSSSVRALKLGNEISENCECAKIRHDDIDKVKQIGSKIAKPKPGSKGQIMSPVTWANVMVMLYLSCAILGNVLAFEGSGLIAYDCGNPEVNLTSYSLLDVASCIPPSNNLSTNEVKIRVWQRNVKSEIRAFQWGKLMSWSNWIGNITSTTIVIYMIGRSLKFMVDTIMHGRILYDIYGLGWQLIASFWNSLINFLSHRNAIQRTANPEPNPQVTNQKSEKTQIDIEEEPSTPKIALYPRIYPRNNEKE